MATDNGGDMAARRGSARPSFRIQYRVAVVLWLISACWIAVLLTFTWLFWRDGPPAGLGPFGWPLLGLLWLAGFSAGASSAGSFALVSMQVDDDGVRVREWLPFKVRTTRCGVADVDVPAIVDGVDDDGDPRFRCELRLPDGRAVSLAESYRRLEVEAVRKRLLVALATTQPR